MRRFIKIFEDKLTKPPKSEGPPKHDRSIEELRKDPDLIRVFDKYGQELFISKKEWRDNILPENIKKAWNNPDELYSLIVQSLHDEFFEKIVRATEQLHKIDTVPSRSATVLGVVYMKTGRLKDAERVLKNQLVRHGEDGCVLTNLAKVYADKNDLALSEKTLWRALQADPNQDNGLGWYEAIHRERNGKEAGLNALRQVAALPKSWRAQLWLARAELESGNLSRAQGYYRESLAHAGTPTPADLLMQMSGDLGNNGHLHQIIELVEPRFEATLHGLQVGNNLIKAHLDTGNLDAARKLIDLLYALKRPDWNDTLSFWDTELAKVRIAAKSADPNKIQVAMLMINGPVWLKPDAPAAKLFPATTNDPVTVAFIGSTADVATNSKRIQHQMADTPGRISRAVPLFLAEQIQFGSCARVQTLIPWVTNPSSGFVLGGVPYNDEDAAQHARQGEIKNDYVVVTHLKPITEPWIIELKLIRTIDAKCLGVLTTSFPVAEPEKGIIALARQLRVLLYEQAGVEPSTVPPLYQVPDSSYFACYLLRLEQLLAVRCAGMDGTPAGFLNGEREILDGNIQQCLAHPENVSTRILLAQTLHAFKRVHPGIITEFRDKICLLQKEHPLPQPAQVIVQRLFNEALSTHAE